MPVRLNTTLMPTPWLRDGRQGQLLMAMRNEVDVHRAKLHLLGEEVNNIFDTMKLGLTGKAKATH